MKLILLQDYLRCGGTEKQCVLLAKYLQTKGNDITLVSFRPDGKTTVELRPNSHQILQKFDSGLDWLAPGLFRKIRSIAPQGIICFGTIANCYAGFIQLKFPGISVISTARSGKTLSLLHRWSVMRTRNIFVNSRWWEKQLRIDGFPSKWIHVIHNPLLLHGRIPNNGSLRKQIRSKIGVSENTIVFLCNQGFRQGKNQSNLIRYFTQIPKNLSWQLWFIGEGRMMGKCQRLVQEQSLNNRIKFLGFKKDPTPYYIASDVGVTASCLDSLPNFIVEAQSLGLPVIASDYRGVKEAFLPNESGILVQPDQPEKFVEALTIMIVDQGLRYIMGKRGREFSKSCFSQKNQLKKTANAIELVITGKNETKIKSIILSRPDRIGDVVISTSAIKAIKDVLPQAKIYFLVQEEIELLIKDHPLIEGVISLSDHVEPFALLVNRLKEIQACCLVHLHFNDLVEQAAIKAGVPTRVGFSQKWNRRSLTNFIPDKKKLCLKHEAEYNFDILQLIGIKKTKSIRPYISPDPGAKRTLNCKISALLGSKKFAVFHLTSHKSKTVLSCDLFVDLAHWLRTRYDLMVVILGIEKEHPNLTQFKSRMTNQTWIIDLVGKLNLAESAWLLSSSSLTIGRDSGICHISAAMGAPTFSIMIPLGKNLAATRWRPLGDHVEIYQHDLKPNILETTQNFQTRYVKEIRLKDISGPIGELVKKNISDKNNFSTRLNFQSNLE